MGESEKESVMSSVCLWLLVSTVLSLSSGCRSSLSRPWKLWPLQGGWGQIRLFRSHHSPACSLQISPTLFLFLLSYFISMFADFKCVVFVCSFCRLILQAGLLILVVSESVLLLAGHQTCSKPPTHPSYLVSVNHSVSLVCHYCMWPDARFLHAQ